MSSAGRHTKPHTKRSNPLAQCVRPHPHKKRGKRALSVALPSLLCPWRQLPLPYCLLLVIVARPLGACLLLKTPPLLPCFWKNPGVGCLLCPSWLPAFASGACYLLLRYLPALGSLLLPVATRATLSRVAAPEAVRLLSPRAGCAGRVLHCSAELPLPSVCCLLAIRLVRLLVPVQVLASLRSGTCFTSCRLPVHSLVAPLLPALVVSSWFSSGSGTLPCHPRCVLHACLYCGLQFRFWRLCVRVPAVPGRRLPLRTLHHLPRLSCLLCLLIVCACVLGAPPKTRPAITQPAMFSYM